MVAPLRNLNWRLTSLEELLKIIGERKKAEMKRQKAAERKEKERAKKRKNEEEEEEIEREREEMQKRDWISWKGLRSSWKNQRMQGIKDGRGSKTSMKIWPIITLKWLKWLLRNAKKNKQTIEVRPKTYRQGQ